MNISPTLSFMWSYQNLTAKTNKLSMLLLANPEMCWSKIEWEREVVIV